MPHMLRATSSRKKIIGGRVHGTIHANRVKLNGRAIVEGDIFHRSLSIDENARFEGSSRREETVIDAPPIPIIRPEAQADVDTVVAMEEILSDIGRFQWRHLRCEQTG